MSKARALLLIALCLGGAAHAQDWSAWQRAYDPATRTRFVPVELWTGAPWDGTQEVRMAPAALEFGRRGDKSIKGPTTWNGIQGLFMEGRGRGTDMRCVYSPLRGLVDVRGNE